MVLLFGQVIFLSVFWNNCNPIIQIFFWKRRSATRWTKLGEIKNTIKWLCLGLKFPFSRTMLNFVGKSCIESCKLKAESLFYTRKTDSWKPKISFEKLKARTWFFAFSQLFLLLVNKKWKKTKISIFEAPKSLIFQTDI